MGAADDEPEEPSRWHPHQAGLRTGRQQVDHVRLVGRTIGKGPPSVATTSSTPALAGTVPQRREPGTGVGIGPGERRVVRVGVRGHGDHWARRRGRPLGEPRCRAHRAHDRPAVTTSRSM